MHLKDRVVTATGGLVETPWIDGVEELPGRATTLAEKLSLSLLTNRETQKEFKIFKRFNYFFLTTLLRYNSHIIQLTPLKCKIQWF